MIFLFNEYEELQHIIDQTSDVWGVELNETLEGLFTFQFTMSGEEDISKQIKENWLVGVEDIDGKGQLFKISGIEEDHVGGEYTKTINCEHEIVNLLDVIIENEFIDRKLDDTALETILKYTEWEVGVVEVGLDRHTFTIEYKNALESLKTFSKRWGSEIAYEVTFEGSTIGKRFVHSYQQRGHETGKRLDYDKDLESVKRVVDTSNIKTAMFGTAKVEQQGENQEENQEEKDDLVTFEDLLWSSEPNTTNLLTEYQSNAEGSYAEKGGEIQFWSEMGASMYGNSSFTAFKGSQAHWIRNQSNTPSDMSIGTIPIKSNVIGGQFYTASAYYHVNAVKNCSMIIWFYAEDGSLIEGVESDVQSIFDSFERITYTVKAPNHARSSAIECKVYDADYNVSFRVDAMQLERSDRATTWLVGGEERTWGEKPTDKPFGQRWIGDEDAREKFGRVVNGTKTHKFGVFDSGSVMTPQELLEETWRQLEGVKDPLTQYEVQAVDLNKLANLNPIEVRLGDIVNVVDHDLDLKIKARVIERKVDLFNPELAEFKLGNFLPFLSKEFDQIALKIDDARAEIEEKLDRGEIIQTDWLEEEIELLNNLVRTGQGTVTMTDDNGILVTDRRDNPTKALRLLGGVFAIANSKNADGTWAWSTFGTGDGFSARHINTETMRFDRLQGGKLKLGGAIEGYYENEQPIYQNGILEVYDQEGNLSVELTGNNRGFDYLNVNELYAPNVVSKSMNDEEWILYVDVVNGQDGNEGTETSPKRSIQGALNSLPIYLTANIRIKVVNTDTQWSENVVCSGYMGEGKLYIELGERNTLQGSIWLRHVTVETWISTDGTGSSFDNRATIDSWNVEGWHGTVDIEACNYAFIFGIKISQKAWNGSGNTKIQYGINGKSTRIRFQDVEVYDTESSGIMIQYGSIGIIRNCYGLCPSGVRNYNSLVIIDGTIPNGSGTDVITQLGGVTSGDWTVHSGVAVDPPPPRATLELIPYDTQSFRDYTNGWADDWRGEDVVYQGEYEYYGNHIGVMLFSRATILEELTNPDGSKRNVVSARLKLTRFDNGGSSAKGYPTFWTTTATQTGGDAPRPPLYNSWKSTVGWAWGESHWVNIPTSMIDAIYNGHTGLATYHSSGNPYLRWYGRGYGHLASRPYLEITHE